ncbi:MAG: hypothetical protein RL268_1984 [Pseudomonadota bacterium]
MTQQLVIAPNAQGVAGAEGSGNTPFPEDHLPALMRIKSIAIASGDETMILIRALHDLNKGAGYPINHICVALYEIATARDEEEHVAALDDAHEALHRMRDADFSGDWLVDLDDHRGNEE